MVSHVSYMQKQNKNKQTNEKKKFTKIQVSKENIEQVYNP